MENHILSQLTGLAMAVLSGMSAALLYDVLRPFRVKKRLWRWLTHGLDVLFALGAMMMFLRLAMSLGEGQLRLYMLLGGAAGAVVWWVGPGPLWREIWCFWLSAAADMGRKLARPVLWAGKKLKKGFSFLKKWSTMVGNKKRSAKEDVP